MLKKLLAFVKKNYSVAVLVVLFSVLPAVALAAGSGVEGGLSDVKDSFGNTAITADDIPRTIAQVIEILLGIAGAVAVLFVLFGGFQYMTAGGSDDQVKKGKATIFNALIGIVLIVLAYAIVNVVVTLVTRGA